METKLLAYGAGIVLAALGAVIPAMAADVNLRWDAVDGATGYHLYQDDGAGVWTQVVDTTNTTATVAGVPEDRLVLFRVSAYNLETESIRTWSGAWYDHRQWIESPSGASIQ